MENKLLSEINSMRSMMGLINEAEEMASQAADLSKAQSLAKLEGLNIDIKNFLEVNDPILKKYYACHCTFVRENIKNNTADIPKEWCNCSGGFAKFPFEVILDQPLNVTLLNTPLDGDNYCRFEIDLTNVEYKKKPM